MLHVDSIRYHVLKESKSEQTVGDDSVINTETNADLYHNRIAFTSLIQNPSNLPRGKPRGF